MGFLNMEAAAKEFGTSVYSLRLAAKGGKMPGARKIGGRWYVHLPTLERYFESSLPAEYRQPAACEMSAPKRKRGHLAGNPAR
jgi:hypothetical protein